MKKSTFTIVTLIILIILFYLNIFIGKVNVSFSDFLAFLFNPEKIDIIKSVIVSSRLNSTITAFVTGAALAVSGLLLQTLFKNPLADSSILGIGSGASLGVALVILFLGSNPIAYMSVSSTLTNKTIVTIASLLGTIPILLILLAVSKRINNNLVILITGIMIAFINSSLIAVLQFFSRRESLQSYMLWGMGSFSNIPTNLIGWYSIPLILVTLSSLFLIKPLNAILLGTDYAKNLGINITNLNFFCILISGIIIGLTTAYCGPISFIGLAAPHIVKMSTKQANHKILLPYTMVFGGLFAMFSLFITRLPGLDGALPINVITSLVGAPILIKILFTPTISKT